MNLFEEGDVTVRNSTLEDILILRETMRKEDRDEIWAAYRQTPEQALMVCYALSDRKHTILRNDRPITMFGLIPEVDRPGEARVWMLGSEEVNYVKKSFLRVCQTFVKAMLYDFSVLYNIVDSRYKKSVAWLRWCGADVYEAKPYGPDQIPFHYVTFRRA